MRANIIKIGNSRGLRIPKPMLEQAGITDTVELTLESGRLVVVPAKAHPRDGWGEDAETAIVRHGLPENVWAGTQPTTPGFDESEWTWPEQAFDDSGGKPENTPPDATIG